MNVLVVPGRWQWIIQLTGCEKGNRTYDRIAYCEYCPENGDRFWISNIICRMQMIRVNVFDFRSHDCFDTCGWALLLVSTNLYVVVSYKLQFWLICAAARTTQTRSTQARPKYVYDTDDRTNTHSLALFGTANARFSCKLVLFWYFDWRALFFFFFFIIFRFHLNWTNGCFIKHALRFHCFHCTSPWLPSVGAWWLRPSLQSRRKKKRKESENEIK